LDGLRHIAAEADSPKEVDVRSRAIVILLLVAATLCAIVPVASAGMRSVTSPMLISAHGAQGAGLIWGGGGNAPAPPPTIAIGQHFANFFDLVDQISRPTWRRFPGLGWWGDKLQID
jgi:hypothetical protein